MDLALTADQEAVRDTFGRLFERESTPARVRAAAAGGLDADLWARVVEMGAPALAAPEANGGGGGTLLDVALVVGEQGRTLAAIPLVEAAVTARLFARSKADDLVVAAAAGHRCTLAPRPVAEGVARSVPEAAAAESAVVLDGTELVVVPAVAAKVVAALGDAAVADVPTGDATRRTLATGADAVAQHAVAVAEWQALTASRLAGAAQAALTIAAAYVTERRQFDSPIGAFQSVAHRLADVAVAVEAARLLALQAAWSADEDAAALEASATTALAFATEAAGTAVRESLHFHGGYGFMLEYDVQLYYQRVKAWALAAGDRAQLLRRVGARVGAGVSE